MKKALTCSLLFFSIVFYAKGQSKELENIQSSLPQITDSLRYVDAINRMAMLLYEKNIDSTFYYTIKARAIADRLGYKKGKADATNNLGVFYDIKGNLQFALRYYNDAYISYTKLKDSANQVQAMMNIAMVYKEMGRDGKSLAHYNASLNYGKKLSKDSIMSLAIYNYLLQFPLRFNKSERTKLISEARNIAVNYKDQRTLLAIEQLIADDLIANGQRVEGLALLDKTIKNTIALELYYVSMDMLIDIGDQLLTSDPKKAATYYQQGLTIANQNGYLIYSKLLARKLFDLYVEQQNYTLANEYAQELIVAIEKKEELDSHSGVDYLDYAIKEKQVETLVNSAKYQMILLFLSAIVCLFAITIIVFIRQNLKRSKRLNSMISEQNNTMKNTLVALEQSQEENSRVMQIITHDLRSPMAAIVGLSDFMIAEHNLSVEDLEVIQLINTSGKDSLKFVNEILEKESNAAELKKEKVNLHELLSYCTDQLQFKAKEKNQNITLTSVNISLPLNREKIWRVMSNLITNAIKFSPSNSIIAVSLITTKEDAVVSIKDSGIGIPEELKDKIFDASEQGRRTGTDGEKSFGLGLAISKQIVAAHGGSLSFESKLGEGTTFFVKLPLI
ncbi:MAG: sensor histidine kinase [Pedobacter sp.]|nr:MAG: sensor histidine kinase [Pedobacter sp.]